MQIIPFSAFGDFLAKDVFKTAVVVVWGRVGDGVSYMLGYFWRGWGLLEVFWENLPVMQRPWISLAMLVEL